MYDRKAARVPIVRDRPHERTEMVRVRLSITEKLELSHRADAENIPIPAYLRKRALAEDHSKELLSRLKEIKVCFQVALMSFPLDIAKEGMEVVREAESAIAKYEGRK